MVGRGTRGALVAAFVFATSSGTGASAQGIFDNLFGRFQPRPSLDLLPRPSAATEPLQLAAPTLSLHPKSENKGMRDPGGPWVAFCVRLCDGRFFPLARSLAVGPAEQCRALCPAAKTKVFGGNSINQASAADGSRYAGLATAFLYRTRVVDDCTCNGRDAFGIARVDLASDPTLRAGDIVAINGGFAVHGGPRTAGRNGGFTPIAQSAQIPAEVRRRLSETKVLPVRQSSMQAPAPSGNAISPLRRNDRSAQLLR